MVSVETTLERGDVFDETMEPPASPTVEPERSSSSTTTESLSHEMVESETLEFQSSSTPGCSSTRAVSRPLFRKGGIFR